MSFSFIIDIVIIFFNFNFLFDTHCYNHLMDIVVRSVNSLLFKFIKDVIANITYYVVWGKIIAKDCKTISSDLMFDSIDDYIIISLWTNWFKLLNYWEGTSCLEMVFGFLRKSIRFADSKLQNNFNQWFQPILHGGGAKSAPIWASCDYFTSWFGNSNHFIENFGPSFDWTQHSVWIWDVEVIIWIC